MHGVSCTPGWVWGVKTPPAPEALQQGVALCPFFSRIWSLPRAPGLLLDHCPPPQILIWPLSPAGSPHPDPSQLGVTFGRNHALSCSCFKVPKLYPRIPVEWGLVALQPWRWQTLVTVRQEGCFDFIHFRGSEGGGRQEHRLISVASGIGLVRLELPPPPSLPLPLWPLTLGP